MARSRFYITTVASSGEGGTPPNISFDSVTEFTPNFSSKISSYPISDLSQISNHTSKNNPTFQFQGWVSTQPLTSYDNNLVGYSNLSGRPQIAYNVLKAWHDSKTELFIYSEYDNYSPLIITSLTPVSEATDSLKVTMTMEMVRRVGYQRVILVQNMTDNLKKDGSPTASAGNTGKNKENEERRSQVLRLLEGQGKFLESSNDFSEE